MEDVPTPDVAPMIDEPPVEVTAAPAAEAVEAPAVEIPPPLEAPPVELLQGRRPQW